MQGSDPNRFASAKCLSATNTTARMNRIQSMNQLHLAPAARAAKKSKRTRRRSISSLGLHTRSMCSFKFSHAWMMFTLFYHARDCDAAEGNQLYTNTGDRVVFDNFVLRPVMANNASTFTCDYAAPESFRSAAEDCLRLYANQSCFGSMYCGLGGTSCLVAGNGNNPLGDAVLIGGGVFDFTGYADQSLTDVEICVAAAMDSSICLERFQINYPNVAAVNYSLYNTATPVAATTPAPTTLTPTLLPSASPTLRGSSHPTAQPMTFMPTAGLSTLSPSVLPSTALSTLSPSFPWVLPESTTAPSGVDAATTHPTPHPTRAPTSRKTQAPYAVTVAPVPHGQVTPNEDDAPTSQDKTGSSGTPTPLIAAAAASGFLAVTVFLFLLHKRQEQHDEQTKTLSIAITAVSSCSDPDSADAVDGHPPATPSTQLTSLPVVKTETSYSRSEQGRNGRGAAVSTTATINATTKSNRLSRMLARVVLPDVSPSGHDVTVLIHEEDNTSKVDVETPVTEKDAAVPTKAVDDGTTHPAHPILTGVSLPDSRASNGSRQQSSHLECSAITTTTALPNTVAPSMSKTAKAAGEPPPPIQLNDWECDNADKDPEFCSPAASSRYIRKYMQPLALALHGRTGSNISATGSRRSGPLAALRDQYSEHEDASSSASSHPDTAAGSLDFEPDLLWDPDDASIGTLEDGAGEDFVFSTATNNQRSGLGQSDRRQLLDRFPQRSSSSSVVDDTVHKTPTSKNLLGGKRRGPGNSTTARAFMH